MTNDELEAGLVRVANALENLAATTNSGFTQLTQAQLRFQGQLGDLARIFQARIDAQDRIVEEIRVEVQEMRVEMEALQQRQAESDQRFEVLLVEVRYLIRQLPPQPES